MKHEKRREWPALGLPAQQRQRSRRVSIRPVCIWALASASMIVRQVTTLASASSGANPIVQDNRPCTRAPRRTGTVPPAQAVADDAASHSPRSSPMRQATLEGEVSPSDAFDTVVRNQGRPPRQTRNAAKQSRRFESTVSRPGIPNCDISSLALLR